MTDPLRVAVFAFEFPALSETFVLDQVVALLARGHDVVVFAERPRADSVVHPDVERYRLRRRIRYRRMPANPIFRLAGVPAAFARCGWRGAGVLMRALDVRRYGRAAASLRLFYWAAALCKEAPFDVVHCHFGPIGQTVAQLRDLGAIDGRLVTVFHGVDASAQLRASPGCYRFLFGAGDLFLPVSREWRRRLVESGCDPRRIAVHRMGVDTSGLRYRPRSCEPGRTLRVLTVGRLIEKKGIEHGLRAIAQLARAGFDVAYDIAGDGPLRPSLERLAAHFGIGQLVRFHGWLDRTAVVALMRDADILLAPSVTARDGDQEGIPVTLMEAMAAGLPVVATRHSGIPELIEDGRSGLLVPERNSAAVASALIRLLHAPGESEYLARNARERVCEEFDSTKLVAELERRFVSLIDGDAREAPRTCDRAAPRRQAVSGR